MSKTTRSFSIDEEIDEELTAREDINASGIVNSYLREFLDATDATDEEVIIREINKQIGDIDDTIEKKERKKERLRERKERIKNKSEAEYEEKHTEVINNAKNVPADPENGYVVEHAEELDMTPEELAREIAETHNKEFDPFNKDDDLRSL